MRPTLLTIDFETFYHRKAKYSLTSLDTIEYVRDPRFKAHGFAAVIYGPHDTRPRSEWVSAKDIPSWLAQWDPTKVIVIGHNLMFDNLILVEHYGFRAAQFFDTMAAARALRPHLQSYSLDSIGQLEGLGGKEDRGALDDLDGVRDLTPAQEQRLATYAIRDAVLTTHLAFKYYTQLPPMERTIASITTRFSTDARVKLDLDLVKLELEEATARHKAILAASPVPKTTLASNPKFAAWMRSVGIDPPMKRNKKDKETYAFAKDDRAFQLLMADHPEHAAVWTARLNVKSTLDITRAERFLGIGSTGLLPCPLNYYSAHTGRWGGAEGLNLQNLRRHGRLRQAMMAPPGYEIIAADSSQIELRFNAWFSGEEWLLDAFANNDDPYAITASEQFGRPITKADVPERQFGKVLELGLGFQMGPPTLRRQLAIGMLGLAPKFISEPEAQRAVNIWRGQHSKIRETWYWLHGLLNHMSTPDNPPYVARGLEFGFEYIKLPNGLCLRYPNLRFTADGWLYGYDPENPKRIYGGKMLENIVQALARIAIAEYMILIDRLPQTQVILTVHDEILALAPSKIAAERTREIEAIMTKPPIWAPNIPLGVEAEHSERYG